MDERERALEEIADHRRSIDSLDTELVSLLNERAVHSLSIRALKPAAHMNLYDPAREEQILLRLEAKNEGPMSNANLREIYSTLLKVMKEIEA